MDRTLSSRGGRIIQSTKSTSGADGAYHPPMRLDLAVVLGDPRLADSAKIRGVFAAEDHDAFDRMRQALAEVADEPPGASFRYLDRHDRLLDDLRSAPPDLVLNFCDTGFMNRAELELHVPALLEMLGIPYSGAGPSCLALCYDKAAVRAIALDLGIRVPEERFLRPDEPPEAAVDAWGPERFPVLVKPNRGDGSVGITRRAVAWSAEEALECIRRLRRGEWGGDRPAAYDAAGRDEILIQEYLDGREYGIGLVGNPGAFTVLPPMEVDFSDLPAGLPPILSYESKADPDSPYYTRIGYRRADVHPRELETMVGWSKRLFERLGCRDYARFDFRAGADGRPRLLEVNPNPAWCWDGKMAFMIGFAGGTYPNLLRAILDAALARTGLAVDQPGSPW